MSEQTPGAGPDLTPHLATHTVTDTIQCVSFRDQPWAEAEPLIRAAWDAGYRTVVVDDAFEMHRPLPEWIIERWAKERIDIWPESEIEGVEKVIELATSVWWIDGGNHGLEDGE